MLIYTGVDWDYNNLNGIGYDSNTLLEPYATWVYQITGALNYEKELINIGLSENNKSSSIYESKDNIIKLSDYFKRNTKRYIDETINVNDYDIRKIDRLDEERFLLNDFVVPHLKKLGVEPTVYLLDEARYITYNESTQLTNVVEQIELSGSACLFDFEAKNGVWSENDFVNWCDNNSPINYNELRPFIPGEYEYKDAYAGFRLKISPTSGRFGVAHSSVYIDVEDTVEKGTVEHTYDPDTGTWVISGAAMENGFAKVSFSKRFYTSPQIIKSLNFSQQNCYVDVDSWDRDGFKFRMKSVADGAYVTETTNWSINWLADGY